VGATDVITHSLRKTYLPTERPYSNRGSEDSLAIISDVEQPPLGVKLTGYRLLNMGVVFVFGLTKAVLTYMGQSAVPTTLDWVSGALLAVWWVFRSLGTHHDGN